MGVAMHQVMERLLAYPLVPALLLLCWLLLEWAARRRLRRDTRRRARVVQR
jgi:hypothetical protein